MLPREVNFVCGPVKKRRRWAWAPRGRCPMKEQVDESAQRRMRGEMLGYMLAAEEARAEKKENGTSRMRSLGGRMTQAVDM